MEEYILKSALAAEIENLENTYKKCPTRNSYEEGLKDGRLIGYKDALHKIDALGVKDPNQTMSKAEKFISDCTRGCSNELVAAESRAGKEAVSYHPWLTPDQARRAVEIAREEMIEKAVVWMETHTFMFESLEDVELYKELFKQAMKDEQDRRAVEH